MENVLLLDITIGSKELVISRARFDDTLVHTNQVSAYIDRRVHSDCNISFVSWKSCNEMSIDFGRNTNDGIRVNPPITIGSIIPQITSTKSGNERRRIGFGQNIGDYIPPRNIRSFGLFDRVTSEFSDRSVSWHGAVKNES